MLPLDERRDVGAVLRPVDEPPDRQAVLRPVEGLPRRLRRLLLTAARVVLFVCVENAARSLMAEAIFNADPAPGWTATSAGTRPARAPNPRTAPMLSEIGLPMPDHPPRLLTPSLSEGAALPITMGCLDDRSCPAHLKSLGPRDWNLPDPAPLDDRGFREVRDRISALVAGLRQELVRSGSGPIVPVPSSPR